MLVTIVACLLIILGFVFKFIDKKVKKDDVGSLYIAKVIHVEKADDHNYKITFKHSYDKGNTFWSTTLIEKKKMKVNDSAILSCPLDKPITLYEKDKKFEMASILCWVIGLCIFMFL